MLRRLAIMSLFAACIAAGIIYMCNREKWVLTEIASAVASEDSILFQPGISRISITQRQKQACFAVMHGQPIDWGRIRREELHPRVGRVVLRLVPGREPEILTGEREFPNTLVAYDEITKTMSHWQFVPVMWGDIEYKFYTKADLVEVNTSSMHHPYRDRPCLGRLCPGVPRETRR